MKYMALNSWIPIALGAFQTERPNLMELSTNYCPNEHPTYAFKTPLWASQVLQWWRIHWLRTRFLKASPVWLNLVGWIPCGTACGCYTGDAGKLPLYRSRELKWWKYWQPLCLKLSVMPPIRYSSDLLDRLAQRSLLLPRSRDVNNVDCYCICFPSFSQA